MQYAFKSHRLLVSLVTLIILTIGLGILIVPLETPAPQTKFKTLEDGIWWSFTTVTGVGFGDLYPVTTAGRVIGVVLETIGVTIFGLIIALVTVSLLRSEQQFYWGRITERFDRLEEKLGKLEQKANFSIKNNQKSLRQTPEIPLSLRNPRFDVPRVASPEEHSHNNPQQEVNEKVDRRKSSRKKMEVTHPAVEGNPSRTHRPTGEVRVTLRQTVGSDNHRKDNRVLHE